MTFEMGVMRAVVTFAEDDPDGEGDTQWLGSLVAYCTDPEPGDAPILGDHVIYTLGLDRLRSLLELAAAGHAVDGLLLSLEAVVLQSEQYALGDDDEDGGDPG